MRLFFGCILVAFGIYLALHDANYTSESLGIAANTHEVFDPNLVRIRNINGAQNYIDSICSKKTKSFDSFLYLQTTKDFVKNKFYHGSAEYSWRENWICWTLGKTIWSHFTNKVAPKDILKHSQAMCSQQTMVFTQLMQLKGFNYRYVYLFSKNGGHFCCEVWQGGVWHFVDVNMEPQWNKIKGPSNISIEEALEKDCLEKIYDSSYACVKEVTHLNPTVKYEKVNKKLGEKMKYFQTITSYLSWSLLVLLGILLIAFTNKK
jgi:hypothetical protein